MLDPNQRFVARSYTRKHIANSLNAAIEVAKSDVPHFAPDDPRLTDEVCRAFAESTWEAMDLDAVAEAEHEAWVAFLDRFEE